MTIVLPCSYLNGLNEGPIIIGIGRDLGLPSMVCVARNLIAFIETQRDIDALAIC